MNSSIHPMTSSIIEEQDELQERLARVSTADSGSDHDDSGYQGIETSSPMKASFSSPSTIPTSGFVIGGGKQWSTMDGGKTYTATGDTMDEFVPGVYEIKADDRRGLFYEHVPVKQEGLIRFPDTNADRVIQEISRFWDSEEVYRYFGLLYKRGIMTWGPPGNGKCFAKGTQVMLYDGSAIPVEEVRVDDLLMGPDSQPRRVLGTTSGQDEMYDVTPVKGAPYRVNSHHVLSLKMSGGYERQGVASGDFVNISVREYLNSSADFKHHAKGYRVGVDFPERDVPVEPYFLGLWLGDGTVGEPSITTMDDEIVVAVKSVATSHELAVRVSDKNGHNRSKTYYVTGRTAAVEDDDKVVWQRRGWELKDSNPVTRGLRQAGVLFRKHVPLCYKANSAEVRQQVLAGIIDTDGSRNCNGYDVIQARRELAEDIAYLARSLGMAAYVNECMKGYRRPLHLDGDFSATYYRVTISGDTDQIPVRLARKKCAPRQQSKDVLNTGIAVSPAGKGDYYGFEVSGDGLFLLGDFTVTHNSSLLQIVMADVIAMGGVVFKFTVPSLFTTGLRQFREIQPTTPIVITMEDLDAILNSRHYSESEVLQILDGVDTPEKILFLATTNYPELLGERIMNRPSRFDTVNKLGPLSFVARKMYFEYLMKPKVPGTVIGGKMAEVLARIELQQWVQDTDGFSIAHLKELFIAMVVNHYDYKETIHRLGGMKRMPTSSDDGTPVGFRGKDSFYVASPDQVKADWARSRG